MMIFHVPCPRCERKRLSVHECSPWYVYVRCPNTKCGWEKTISGDPLRRFLDDMMDSAPVVTFRGGDKQDRLDLIRSNAPLAEGWYAS